MTTKTELRAAYIANLQAAYPFYTEGSRPLMLAHEAVDAALDGAMHLSGASWFKALHQCGLPKTITLTMLKALPA